MNTKGKIIYLTAAIIFLLSSFKLNSQVFQANFSADTLSGCVPVVINFTNTSTPDTNVNYFWDFGNGTTSNLKNPSTIYVTPGQYTVSLTISDSLNENTIIRENFIEVFGSPVADFSISENNGCLPFSVSPQNNSVQSSGEIIYWLWSFGDGYYSEEENTNHIYDNIGNYTISLYIEDENGCNNQITKNNIVNVHQPVALFNADNLFSCNQTLTTNFENLSYGDSVLYYNWNFGDGTNSTIENPTHNFTDTGEFNVSLEVTDYFGCSDTFYFEEVIVNRSTKSDFEIVYERICKNEQISTINNSENANNYFWDFGDNYTTTSFEPSHSFSDSGIYNISLICTNSYGCSDTSAIQINIRHVEANFEVDRGFLCKFPDSINYINLSESLFQCEWFFGNGNYSDLENPQNVFTSKGYFSDTLVVTDKFGCKDTLIKENNVLVQTPQAYYTPNDWVNPFDFMGCVPLTVDFNDASRYVTPNDSIVEWHWDFGDGFTSDEQNPSHTFTTLDYFLVSLDVTTTLGCTSEYFAWAKTGTKQHASFYSLATDTVCASTPVQFFNNSTIDSLVNYSYWIFGDSTFSTQRNPIHSFQDTGYIDVKLLAYNNGCPDDTLIEDFIYVKGPYIDFDVEQDCENPFDILLSSSFIDTTNFYWDFGDGTPLDSINPEPIHTYNNKGTYSVSVFSDNFNTSCTYSSTVNIYVADAEPYFSVSDSTICQNNTVLFDASSSIDLVTFYQNEVAGRFLWDFGDGTDLLPTFDTIVNHTFNSEGDFIVKLIGYDLNGCPDTTMKTIKVHKPHPGFEAIISEGCSPLKVSFIDTSYSYYDIENYEWVLGNQQTSNLQNPTTFYCSPGNYTVQLKITDELGCENTMLMPNYINVYKPDPNFWTSKTNICSGEDVQFTIVQQIHPISEVLWDFGDGNFSTEISPTYSYQSGGDYNVTLTITDIFGCDSSMIKSSYIHVQDSPEPEFIADNTNSYCYPFIVNFEDLTDTTQVAQRYWQLNSNTSSVLKNPSCTYLVPGDYNVSLTVTSQNGCATTITKENFISVKGPWGVVNTQDTVCVNAPSLFSVSEQLNVFDIQWFFGDGGTSFDYSSDYTYIEDGEYNIVVLLRSDEQNTCNKYFFDTVYVRGIDAGMYSDKGFEGCTPFDFVLTDTTAYTYNRIWQIDDFYSDSLNSISFYIENPGEYNVSLFETDKFGCKDTSVQQIIVHDLPKVTTLKDTFVCAGDLLNLYANGAKTYQWFPDVFLDNSDIQNPISLPDNDILYSVLGTDSNGCSNYDEILVKVINQPRFSVVDTSLIIGDSILFSNYFEDIGAYYWSPNYQISCDTCSSLVLSPTETTVYDLTIVDTAGCFELTKSFTVDVILKYSIDVPSAFTPNNDGNNDEIFVKGWGIEHLNYFNIYNIYGELVFSSTEINKGWDGYYKGKKQPVGTYRYLASVTSYDGQIRTKEGTIKIIY